MSARVTFSVILLLLAVLPSLSACDVPYGPNSPHLSSRMGASSTSYPNGSLVQEENSYIFCYVEPLNSTHYIINVETDENGILTNRTNIHQYKSIIDTTDKNRPSTTNSINIIQHVPRNGSLDRSNSYYNASQETSSSPNRNNEYYNVQDTFQNSFEIARGNSYYSFRQKRQERPQNGTSTTPSRTENTQANRPSNSPFCVLPEQPEGGHFDLDGCNKPCNKHFNDIVPEYSVLIYTCKDNHILIGNTISICTNRKWTTPPLCLKICEPLRSTSVDISCSYRGETVSCIKHVLPGTRAMLACKPSYILPLTYDLAYREITCLNDGLWDNQVFRCFPVCGTSITHGSTLNVHGFNATIEVFPWHVGIYLKKNATEYEQICGGTLINTNLVISAAYCFYDETFNKVNTVTNYAVGAGKYYRDWNAKEDYAQKSSIKSIQIGSRYLGFRNNYADDIALLKLEIAFELTTFVRPVCMDWSNQYEREQLQQGQVGKVVGWGKNINGEFSEILQEINIPYIPYQQCMSGVPESFQRFITRDKFCADYLNGNLNVCDGDSGVGLCFEKNGIWYLRGIVSVFPIKRGACGYNTYAGYTRISNSLEWIRRAYSMSECDAPEGFGPNSRPIRFAKRKSDLIIYPNGTEITQSSFVECSLRPLNNTHYIVHSRTNIDNETGIHQFRSIVNRTDKNRPSTTTSSNIIQQVPQTSSPNQNNDYYNTRQDVPLNNSPNRNNDYYNVRQEIPSNSRDCFLPEQPEGGQFELSGCAKPCSRRPNDLVPEISVLNYTCKDNHILNGINISICIDRKWTPPPSWLKICEPLRSTSVDISCSYRGETVSCIKHVLPGTRAMLACKPSYILPLTYDLAYREITCLNDGLWDNQVFRCFPVCGTSITHGSTLNVHGFNATIEVFPWHVGIYLKKNATEYEQICGGTLINTNLVISAAYCFYDETFNKVNTVTNYAVGAGKYYRDWNAKEDYAQKSSIKSIQIGSRYLGFRNNYADDIALLKLEIAFELTTFVRPVCMDWSNQYEREQLQQGQVGKVVGWGKNINGEFSEILQEINIPYIPYQQCMSGVPESFQRFITRDKFCAGYLNGNLNVCDGDSGVGLCFEKNGIWYLRGIVSVFPIKRGACGYNTYAGYTRISNSLEWIRRAYSMSDCDAPEGFGPNSRPIRIAKGKSDLIIYPNGTEITQSPFVECSLRPLNNTHYIVHSRTNIDNEIGIHQFRSIVNRTDKNRPSTTTSSNIIQHVPQTSSPNQNNDYYNTRQDVPLNNSPNRNNDYYNVRQEIPSNSRDCFLPEQPEGGQFELSGCAKPCSRRPNDLVPEISVLNYTCKDNHILNGINISICIDRKWTPPPSCLKICSPLRSTSVDISCSYQGETVSCIKNVLPGTRAMLACKPFYTLTLTYDPAYREITCRNDGLWDNLVFHCLPECGTSIAHGITLIVNGMNAKIGAFPWHVGIYFKKNMNEYEQICGGTLISSSLVISAAHCFDEVFNQINNASDYAVGAGKYFREWNARDKYAQKSLIESIQPGKRYLGQISNFVDDIALVKLQTPFRLTTLVRPVCIDWDNQYERDQLNAQQIGKVVGWGKDINGESTRSLYEIDMPFVPYQKCLSEVPVDFRGYITFDKFCAGHLNGSSVCDGDSGGGICFEKNGMWYLRGVVSVSPVRNTGCDYNSYVAFTSIANSYSWIRQIYANALRDL